MRNQLTFTARGKGGPGAKKCEKLFDEATKLMGGAFGVIRMERRGNKYTVDIDAGPRGGISLDDFSNKLTR